MQTPTAEGLLDAARHELDIAAGSTIGATVSHHTRIAHQYTRLAELLDEHPDGINDVTVAVTMLELATAQYPPPEPGDGRPDWAAVAYARAQIVAAMPRLRQQIRLQVPDMAAFGATMIPAPGGSSGG